MAFMKYEECMKSELDLFTVPRVQTGVLRTDEIAYKPIASLDNATTLEFVSVSQGDSYRDLSNIYIYIKCKIVKEDSTSYSSTDANKPSVANNILHSLFRQCTVYLGNKSISQHDNNYAYRAFFEKILNYGNDALSTHLEADGFYLDTHGKLDVIKGDENAGLDKRRNLFANSGTVELIGKLHCDMFNQEKLLLNNVELRVVLTLNKPEFYMLEDHATDTSKIKLMDATLFIHHSTINPSVLIAHEQALSKTNAYYPYRRVEVKSYTIPSGLLTLDLPNIVMGQIPSFILFAMIDNASYVGTRKLNPFNFQKFNLSSFNLHINGQMYPLQPLTFDFKATPSPLSIRAYHNLFKSTNMNSFDRGNQITKKLFDDGCFILAFDLTNDMSATTINCANLLNSGVIRVEGRFATALSKTITCIVYCEYDAILEIDKFRNVYLS